MKHALLLILGLLLGTALAGCGEKKALQEQLVVARTEGAFKSIRDFDYDPASQLIYFIEARIEDNPYDSRAYLYKYDLNTETKTQVQVLRMGTDTRTSYWVSFSKRGTLLVYDPGEFDDYRNVNIPPAIIELENDVAINRIPAVSYKENWSKGIAINDVCRQMLKASPTHIPLGYEDINSGISAPRREPVKLAPRFVLVETAQGTIALDRNLCGDTLFAEYVSDIHTGNSASYNMDVVGSSRGKAWLYLPAADLSYTQKEKPFSFVVNFQCEKYINEIAMGQYTLEGASCIHDILGFASSMHLMLSDHEVLYLRNEGIFKASAP